MVDRVPTIDEIDSKEKLEAYLRTRPVEEAQAIALRCALRVIPLLAPPLDTRFVKHQLKPQLTSGVFRACFIAWAQLSYSTEKTKYAAARAVAAVIAVADVAAYPAAYASAAYAAAADAAVTAASDDTATAADAAAYAASAAAGSASDVLLRLIWQRIRDDLKSAQNGNAKHSLGGAIWALGHKSDLIVNTEKEFQHQLGNLGEQWSVVWDFYVSFRDGTLPFSHLGARHEEVIVTLATAEEAFWDRDANVVMGEIAERLLFVDAKQTRGAEAARNKCNDVDFFISYSTKNEAEAREINAYLEASGYSTIGQFKDFPVGSNFVIEMQEGLERGARAIALLSPEYVASDHCRAEWAAVYNMDPIGKDRKLVPLLLKPAPLNKLARQIVYKSLVGLSDEERRVAVLEAIGGDPALWSPEKLRARLAETSSPDVAPTADGKLDAVPNAIYDRAVYDADLPDLPETLRTLCLIIQGSLPDNCPRTIAPSLIAYGDHLRDRGAEPILGLLSAIAGSLTKDVKSVEFGIWGDGLSDYFDNFFSFHSKFVTHFPKSQVREEVIAANEIDEDRARGKDFVEPVQEVANALGELHLIGGTTPGFERVVQDSLQRAKDINSLPDDPDAGGGTDVTPKRRFIFTQVGFWERVVASLNNMSSLASTEQGKAAIAILTEAIKKFLSFLQ
ncbi:toll/interleukin-1 receptor domain-containing protein [Agrobacterium vitis]